MYTDKDEQWVKKIFDEEAREFLRVLNDFNMNAKLKNLSQDERKMDIQDTLWLSSNIVRKLLFLAKLDPYGYQIAERALRNQAPYFSGLDKLPKSKKYGFLVFLLREIWADDIRSCVFSWVDLVQKHPDDRIPEAFRKKTRKHKKKAGSNEAKVAALK